MDQSASNQEVYLSLQEMYASLARELETKNKELVVVSTGA
jgi:hypothetical protein